jgi:hypothetical protein
VISFPAFLASARTELPGATFARWASIFFSLSVLTILLSLAAAQALLALAAACYAIHLFREQPTIHFPPVKLPLARFSLGTVISVLWAANPAVGWSAVRKLVLLVILLLGVNLVASSKHLEFLYHSLFAESALAGLAILAEGCFEFNFGTSPVLMVFFFVVSTPFVVERSRALAASGSKVES